VQSLRVRPLRRTCARRSEHVHTASSVCARSYRREGAHPKAVSWSAVGASTPGSRKRHREPALGKRGVVPRECSRPE
jgi:hypothetical protein